jgi:hypothetical protein
MIQEQEQANCKDFKTKDFSNVSNNGVIIRITASITGQLLPRRMLGT